MKKIFPLALLCSVASTSFCSSVILSESTPAAVAAYYGTQKAGLNDGVFGTSGLATYGVSGVDSGEFVIDLPSGGYVLAGTYGGLTGAFILYVDKKGTTTKTVQTTALTTIKGITRSANTIYVFGNDGSDTKVVAYDFSGNAITTFGTSGVKTVGSSLGTGRSGIYYDGGLFIMGDDSTSYDLYKLDATGSNVSAFNSGSAVALDGISFTQPDDIDAYNGFIYILGRNSLYVKVVKYNATTGVQVTSNFGSSGFADTTALAGTYEPRSLSVDKTTGEIYVLTVFSGSAYVYKFKTDGTLDTNWASSGILTVATFGDPQEIIAAPGGVQYIVGDNSNVGRVTRIKNGAVDTTFGTAGVATNDSISQLNSGLVDANRYKILAVGGDGSDALLWRLTGGSGTSLEAIIKDNQEAGNARGLVGNALVG